MGSPRQPAASGGARPGRTDSAGQRLDQGAPRTFPCEGCGADLEFHIGQQRLACPYCGLAREVAPEGKQAVVERDYRAMLERLAEHKGGSGLGVPGDREVACGSCGATVVFSGTLTSTECAYCGSPLQRDWVHTAAQRVPVDGVLPFQVDERRAAEQFRRWVASRWFAPDGFRRRGLRGRFQGVYLPYWTFDSLTCTRYVGERGEHYWVEEGSGGQRRRVRRTRWHSVGGSFQHFFDDVLVASVIGLPASLLRRLEPWPLERLLLFTPELLAGFQARTYDEPLERGFEMARQRMEAALHQEVSRRIGGDEQRIHSLEARFDAITYKHLLLPSWILTYRFRDRPYRVVVNAGTGEVIGERPWSAVKIALFVLMLAVLAVILAALLR